MDGRRAGAGRRLGVGAAIVLVVVALAVTVVLGMVRTAGSPVEDLSPLVPTPGATSARGAPLYVQVDGAVAEPGLYRLDPGSRVVDAVGAAGGFTHDADRQGVNLARELTDGEQLLVPREGESPPPSTSVGPALVNLNTADATALESLPRIGPALAARIIAWREENGRFSSVDDLLAVPGIGDRLLAGLRDLVTV